MATPFPLRDAKLSGAIDRAFGELFTFEAFKAGDDVNGRKTADTSRATFDAIAIWEGPAKSATPTARGSSSDDRAHNWTASFPSVSVDEALLIWTPQPGDKITRKFNGLFYEIARSYPDDMGRIVFQLTAKKRWLVAAPAEPPALKFNAAGNSQFIPLI